MTTTLPRLRREASRPPAPVRIVHLGLGNFMRAHLAWYTAHAPDAAQWGIAAFTGRRPQAAQILAPQDGLYTLITRGPVADTVEVIDAISAVHTASDHTAWLEYFRDPAVAIVSMTVTEAGYFFDGAGLREDPAIAADIAALVADPSAPASTLPGKLVAGLLARKAADAGAITLLPCDNLPGNGAVVRAVVTAFAAQVDPGLSPWLADNVDFASSMVDRITPAATEADRETVGRELGVFDASPVRTEPFSEWVMSGTFPAGRPAWEEAGAQLTGDVHPYEQRKLLLLNAAHSLLAYAGSALGHRTVDAAIADARCRAWVNELWDDAAATIPLPADLITDYRAALLERFANARMGDELNRIAMDGSLKIPVRIVPVIETERAAGRMPQGAARAVAAWIAHLRGHGAPRNDAGGEHWAQRASGDPRRAVTAVLDELGIGGDEELAAAVLGAYAEIASELPGS